MKAFISLIIFVAIALVLMEDTEAAEPKQAQQASAAKTVDSVNYPNYWDAKAWDREGGASFWHAGEVQKGKTAARPAKPAKKGLFARK